MELSTLTRRATLNWLEAIRLPLTAAERVAARAGQEPATWAPTVAFSGFEASVKETVGRLTGDDTLQGLARLQRAEMKQRAEAIEKKLEAKAVRVDVHEEAEQREAELERQRQDAAQRAAARERKLEEDRLAAERQVRERAAKKEAQARETRQKNEQLVADQAARAEAGRLRAEAEALRAKERAVAAEGAVLDLDRAVKSKKAARKS